jgi:hypothetical protein
MRAFGIVAGVVLCVVGTVMAQGGQSYVSAKKRDTGIYENEVRKLNEQALLRVGPDDRLTVLEESRNAYKVDFNGQRGWVEKGAVVKVGKSKTFVFDNADVIGYLDNPTPVYIIDADDPNANPITLDRSFKDALRENVDRETVERQVTK